MALNLKLEDLLEACEKCQGKGAYKQYGRTTFELVSCEKCNAAGGTLTQDGKVMARFMKLLASNGNLRGQVK